MTEILVGIDGSPGARDALAFATRVAEATGAALRLASVFPYSDAPSRGAVPAYREFLRSDAQILLDRAAAAVEGPATATEAIAHTSPPHALHDLAERTGAALVVVGSTRRGPVGRVVPGSTAERLLHGSPCPVAIVPRGYAQAGPIETIGVGYDGSDESEVALAAACQAAHRFGAGLRVMRVFGATRFGAPALMTIPGGSTRSPSTRTSRRSSARAWTRPSPRCLPVLQAEPVFVVGAPGARAGRAVRAGRPDGRRLARLRPARRGAARRRDPHAHLQGRVPRGGAAPRLARSRVAVRGSCRDSDVVIAAQRGTSDLPLVPRCDAKPPPSAPRRALRGSRRARP